MTQSERSHIAGAAIGLIRTAGLLTVNGFLAWSLRQPLLFASLGPTIYMHVETPFHRSASPRNTILGHFVGLSLGLLWLYGFGLENQPAPDLAHLQPARCVAAAAALSTTLFVLSLVRAFHPPAGASTLLPILTPLNRAQEVAVAFLGAVVLALVSWSVHRLAHVPVPFWPSSESEDDARPPRGKR